MSQEGGRPAPEWGDLDPQAFRTCGRRLIDWIAEYLEHPERYPVRAPTEPGETKGKLPPHPPPAGEPLEAILRDVEEVIAPGLTHWNHPGFFGYFAISGSMPGILGELLSAAFNVNAMLWATAPAATELEEVALDWLRRMVGLPQDFKGVIHDTASVSTLCALVAAREALSELDVRGQGLAGRPEVPRLVMYTSQQAHSSVEKAGIVLGIGQANVRKIPTDAAFRLDVKSLRRAIEADLKAHRKPFAVVATVGTTSTTSVDPVPQIAQVARAYDLWLHVDAAYAGAAALLPEKRHVLAGCERADSLVINPHKWLFTPIDCSAFYCRRPQTLKRAFSLVPEYLRTAGADSDSDSDKVTNFMDYGVALGRRFRALKLWMVLRAFGVEGLRSRLREHLRLARLFKGWVEADPDFELLAPVPFSVVCFRARPRGWTGSDEELNRLNESLLERVNRSGEVFLSHTVLPGGPQASGSEPRADEGGPSPATAGRFTIRLAIGHLRTTEAHVRRAWELLKDGVRASIYNP